MADIEQALRLSIAGHASETAIEALEQIHQRLYSEKGMLMVKTFGEMAVTSNMESFDKVVDSRLVQQLDDDDLVNLLLNETNDGMWLVLGHDSKLNDIVDKDPLLNEAIDQVTTFKPDSVEYHNARRRYNAHRLRAFGSYAIKPYLQIVDSEESAGSPRASQAINIALIADEAKIA